MKFLLCTLALLIAFTVQALEPLNRNLLQPDWEEVQSLARQKRESGPVSFRRNMEYDLAELVPKVFMLGFPNDGSTFGNNLSLFTDEILERILRTPTGRSAALRYSQGSEILLTFGVGLSYLKARDYGQSYKQSSELNGHPPYSNYQILGGGHMYIFTNENNLRFDSWTDKRNHVFIPVTPRDLAQNCPSCDERFYRRFAHELAQIADAKTTPMEFKEFKKNYRGSYVCAAYAATYHPLIRLAFSTWRSFQVEDRILRELGANQPSRSSQKNSKTSCPQKLSSYVKLVSQYQNILNYEFVNPIAFSESSCTINYLHLTFQDIMKILDSEKVRDENGVTSSLCDYFSRPQFGPPGYRPLISFGPRPNIGNGTGKMIPAMNGNDYIVFNQETQKIAIETLRQEQIDNRNNLDELQRSEIHEQIKSIYHPTHLLKEKFKLEKPNYLSN